MKIYLGVTKEQKIWCWRKVKSAVRRGKLVAPDRCQLCFVDVETLQERAAEEQDRFFDDPNPKVYLVAHHWNYNRPLSVWWFCPHCHQMLHMLQRAIGVACLTLDGARRLIKDNYWGVPGGYEGFILHDLKQTQEQIAEMSDRVRRLMEKEEHLKSLLISLSPTTD
jgi:hypothetical protein